MTRVSISSGSQISANAGAAIADQGGNAVDAALAAALVSMCTDPGVMAPGASGFITIWPPKESPVVIDAYAEVPGRGLDSEQFSQTGKEVYFDYGGMMSTLIGYGSVATPGMFAGLEMASQLYGNLSWAEIVAPAQQWGEKGFPLTGGAAEYLSYTHEAIYSWHPDSYQTLHHHDGSPLQEGEIVHIPHLAESLQLIAKQGTKAFYTGEIGQKIAAEIQANGGLLTAADLQAYQAIRRSPIRINFDGWEIVTNPAPAMGGACLAAMFLLFQGQGFEKWNEAGVQKIVAIQKAVLNYRRQYLEVVSNRERKAEISRLLKLAKKGNPYRLGKSSETIHTSAVDNDGLACSLTASAGYGSGVMIGGTGLWLNNSLGEIDLYPHGLQGLSPGTRLASNMAPTIARNQQGKVLAIGSPGASRITTAIFQVLVNYLHLGMSLAEAIAYPRLHFEIWENLPRVAFEAGLPVQESQEILSCQFPELSMYFGGVQAAFWDPATGLSEAADPRRAGGVARGGV